MEAEKMKQIGLCVVLIAATLCQSQDIRSKVRTNLPSDQSMNLIDPDSGAFGIVFGTSEDEVIAKLGAADGYIRRAPGQSAMIYGKSRAFLFLNNRLIGLRVTDSLLDWKLFPDTSVETRCDTGESVLWRLGVCRA
jgi:hypothetical protein